MPRNTRVNTDIEFFAMIVRLAEKKSIDIDTAMELTLYGEFYFSFTRRIEGRKGSRRKPFTVWPILDTRYFIRDSANAIPRVYSYAILYYCDSAVSTKELETGIDE